MISIYIYIYIHPYLNLNLQTVNIEGEIRSENADGRIKVLLHNAEMSKVTKPLLCKYYRPISIFRHVMSHGNVSLSSLAQDTKMRPLRSTGKSQSFLAFSTDKKFVLKSLTRSEAKTLRGTLDDYVAHLDQHPNTLLPRFYSLFSITLHRHYQLYMCVMNNVFEHVDPMRSLQDVYDLKGSVHNRTSNKQESQKRQWKDNDLRMHNDQKGTKRLIHPLDTSVRADLLSQLESDVAWLQRFSLMDYSLLVGRVDQTTSPHSSNSKQDRGTLCCIVPAAASEFHLGIIDVLQVWNAKKRAAMLAKSIAYRRTELSTVPPDKYATRFMHFISNYVI